MFNKYLFLIITLSIVQISFTQGKVCEAQSENLLIDLNSIGKCAIKNFKESKNDGFVKIATRNRHIRKNNNSYTTKLKDNLNSVLKKTEPEIKTISKTAQTNTLLVKKFFRFDQVAKPPKFITCPNDMNDENKCVKETFINHILDNLIYPFDEAASGIEDTVWVRFIINIDGYITNITTESSSNNIQFEKEAERLIKLLPKFIPGKHNNNYVNVEYFMPIEFQLTL